MLWIQKTYLYFLLTILMPCDLFWFRFLLNLLYNHAYTLILNTFVLTILAVHSDLWLYHINSIDHLQLSHVHFLRIDTQSTIARSCLYFLSDGGSRKLFYICKQLVLLSSPCLLLILKCRDSSHYYLYESFFALISIFLDNVMR